MKGFSPSLGMHAQSITRSMLIDSMVFGTFLHLNVGRGTLTKGRVMAISLESGYTPPAHAQHFNLDFVDHMGVHHEVYVNTID